MSAAVALGGDATPPSRPLPSARPVPTTIPGCCGAPAAGENRAPGLAARL